MNEISIVTLLNGKDEYIPLIQYNYDLFRSQYKIELIIIDTGNINHSNRFNDENIYYYHLSLEDKLDYMKEIMKNKEQNKENTQLKYLRRLNDLPSGFLRDYAVGMSNCNIIFHMNCDSIYTENALSRKMTYLKKNIECVYSDSMLTYDINNEKIGKIESPSKIFEGTMMHTREFWKRGGFEWEVNQNEGRYFHYNKGVDRKQENYYDCIQVIDQNNYIYHNIKELTIENYQIKIPEIIKDIKIINSDSLNEWITKLYQSNKIKILGYHSKIINQVKDQEKVNIIEGLKQSKISNEILKYSDQFNIFFFNGKYPVWDLFEKVNFDIIFFETNKNIEQMDSIILKCKQHQYLKIDSNIYFNMDYLNK